MNSKCFKWNFQPVPSLSSLFRQYKFIRWVQHSYLTVNLPTAASQRFLRCIFRVGHKSFICVLCKSQKFLVANLPLKMILSYYEKLISDPMNALITVSVNLLNSLWIRILTQLLFCSRWQPVKKLIMTDCLLNDGVKK